MHVASCPGRPHLHTQFCVWCVYRVHRESLPTRLAYYTHIYMYYGSQYSKQVRIPSPQYFTTCTYIHVRIYCILYIRSKVLWAGYAPRPFPEKHVYAFKGLVVFPTTALMEWLLGIIGVHCVYIFSPLKHSSILHLVN